MKIRLDENFPHALHRKLAKAGREVEHIVLRSERGQSAAQILRRLEHEALLFLTQDTDFLGIDRALAPVILVSRIPQALPIRDRLPAWRKGIDDYCTRTSNGSVFELVEPGVVRSAT